MSHQKFVNIARLMTTFNLKIEMLPDNLKCVKCKLVLKDAYRVPCGCRFCRVCIEDLIASGLQSCPGASQACSVVHLSSAAPDHRANKSISRLMVKCLQNGCLHECPLANLEDHLRECPQRSVSCFHEVGGAMQRDKLSIKEVVVSDYLQQHPDSRGPSEMLVGKVANIGAEMETCRREIELLKRELLLKNEQIRSVVEEMRFVKNENNAIKEANEELADRLRALSGAVDERRQSDEQNDARVAAMADLIGANRNETAAELKAVKEDIRATNRDTKSIRDDIYSLKSHVQLIQVLVGLGQVDASCDEWLIEDDVRTTRWGRGDRKSDYFVGAVQPYRYQLASGNGGALGGTLWVRLRVHDGPSDALLAWPFRGKVIIIVAERGRREACRRLTRQCRIERPRDNDYNYSDKFKFPHSELMDSGLELGRGLRVSCLIVPGAG